MNISSEKLSDATRNHYEELIGSIGDEYIDYRWKRHPVSRSHFTQTQKSVEFAFGHLGSDIGHLMEIGCGPGTWTDICLRNSRQMTIVDISSEMLKLVRERFAGAPVEYHCGDFISPEIDLPAAFDVIFSARALEYMDNKQDMVKKSAGLLRPGGSLAIVTKNPAWMDRTKKLKTENREEIHSDWVSHQALESYYSSSGLLDVVTYPVCLGSYYPPLNNRLAIKIFDLIQSKVYRKPISAGIALVAESYLTIGRKPQTSLDATR